MRRESLFLLLLLVAAIVLAPRPALAGEPAGDEASRLQVTDAPQACARMAELEAADDKAPEPNTFTVMGDSWGFLFYNSLEDTFVENGYGDIYEFKMRAIPGTTAETWATEPCLLAFVKRIIRDDPGLPVVLISLGGNDFVNDFPDIGEAVFARIEADLRLVVQELIAERNDVTIIFDGYDILHMEKTQTCIDLAIALVGSSEPEVINPYLVELGTLQGRIADDYEQVHHANVTGALQGTPGAPDIYSWSPLRYFVLYPFWQQDCIHMSFRGYRVFTGAIYDWFVANELGTGYARP
ncbi:MAG: SGNH/GDSL hydrolase family protein [Ardenticatenaceae bacterium]